MSLEVFPEEPGPVFSVIDEQEFRTNITNFKSGKENRASLDRFPRRTAKTLYDNLTVSEINTLWNFFRARRGQWQAFLWFHYIQYTWIDEFIAQADGILSTFDLPAKNTDQGALIVYVNSTPTAVTLLTGGGDGGADRIHFAVLPAAGSLITGDIKGQLRMRMRFVNGKMSRERFEVSLHKTGLDLIEEK